MLQAGYCNVLFGACGDVGGLRFAVDVVPFQVVKLIRCTATCCTLGQKNLLPGMHEVEINILTFLSLTGNTETKTHQLLWLHTAGC